MAAAVGARSCAMLVIRVVKWLLRMKWKGGEMA